MVMITPDPWRAMCRAAARVVRNWDRRAVATGRAKSSNGVEGHVDPAGRLGHGVGVGVHGLLVEGVDLGELGRPAGGPDVAGDRLQPGPGPAGQEHPRPLAGERPRHRPADPPRPAVDHGGPSLQQHGHPPYGRVPDPGEAA
jgi:hypothetical protein